eukprot:CCRYP_009834-RC/>CCRYP_009834-RC protein AED:0.07 eAED:0.07 QI:207/1/1/1/0.66/0.57/7/247/796
MQHTVHHHHRRHQRGRYARIRCFLLAGISLTMTSFLLLISWHDQLEAVSDHSLFQLDASSSSSRRGNQEDTNTKWPPTLTVYTEPTSSHDVWYEDPTAQAPKPKRPLPRRNVHSRDLTKQAFPQMKYSSSETTSSLCRRVPSLLPIDQFGTSIRDPYLPWIHDVFLSHDGTHVHVLAQNRRRCHTGKNHLDEMKYWEGQLALFQSVALKRLANTTDYNRDDTVKYRLSTHEEADSDALETRFRCRFKVIDYEKHTVTYQGETLSVYPFNYEFVNWRKKKRTMLEDGKEQSMFWLSPLMFQCPIPETLLHHAATNRLLLDVVPIRTPPRRNDRDGFFFHRGHGGPTTFNASEAYGDEYVVEEAKDSGRWENLPVCSLEPRPNIDEHSSFGKTDGILQSTVSIERSAVRNNQLPNTKKRHRLVACTWTSAIHQRRGNERRIADGKSRLREWITFHLEAGFDHMYIFDNTGANSTIFRLKNEVDPDFGNTSGPLTDAYRIKDDLSSVTGLFPASKVTRIDWPATICNNNRPAHDDPGERSSQYAAEAACRMRYGPHTDWMASMDPDEYFIPMGNYSSWKEILDKVDREEGRKVLKFRSTRARPLLSALEPTFDEGVKECTHEMAKSHNQCLSKKEENTYLETYNCEYIKSPKPDRFARAMKQIYRPDFVLSHFVHYSTVTTDLATERQHTKGVFVQDITTNEKTERFVDDEQNEGVLIHAKTTVPAETFSRETMCKPNAQSHCLVGIPCPDNLPFSDALHTKNVFHNEKGEFCNCWMNRKVENFWVPRLRNALGLHGYS